MKEIIDWLITVELLANDFYYKAAGLFPEDKEFTHFIRHIADDEAYHYHIMGSAAEYVFRSKTHQTASIIVGAATRNKIETPFKTNKKLVENYTLTKNALIDCIVESEFSEWNEIFLYVVNSLKTEERIFEHSASKIQYHFNYIKHYLKTTEYGKQKLDEFAIIPNIWDQKILIVDDDKAIVTLLAAVLENDWTIDTAHNGEEALSKAKRTYYDLIISDIDMPVMGGIEFFRKLSSSISNLNDIFIFHSGGLSPDQEEYFKQNDIAFLQKPSSIQDITSLVRDKLRKYENGIN